MPDPKDPSGQPRKHRVIHWNPEEDESQENADRPFGKLLAAGGALFVAVLIFAALAAFDVVAFAPSDGGGGQPASQQGAGQARANAQQEFVSRSKAEFVRESTLSSLEEIRRMPAEHPSLLQKLIGIEREFRAGERLMSGAEYAEALEQFRKVDAQIKSFSEEIESKQASQALYDEFIVLSREYERGRDLNEEAFERAFEDASAGKQFLDEGSFHLAKSKLEDAIGRLEEVKAAIDERVASEAARGLRLIAQGDGEGAREAFQTVLKYDPDNEEAVRLLERAKRAEEAYAKLQEAKRLEESGQLEKALQAYQAAREIDPQSARAQQGVARARRAIEVRDFNFHLEAAVEAEANQRYAEAIERFQKALEIFPSRSEIRDAIEKARQDKRRHDIVTMIKSAYAHEGNKEWEEARAIYKELLVKEPDLREAKDGLLRTGRMIRHLLRYEKLIEVATQEARSGDFQLAIRSFDKAMQEKPAYLELSDEVERLRRYLQLQSQPVPVTITSDNSTTVAIMGPTRISPQKFREETFNLLPGNYFIVGRRRNYQDVRIRLQIRGGSRIEPIRVVAENRR